MQDGVIAQLVEQWTENPCVAGSTPARTTALKKPWQKCWGFFLEDILCSESLFPAVQF